MESVGGDALAARGAQPAVEETKPALAGHGEHPVLEPPKEYVLPVHATGAPALRYVPSAIGVHASAPAAETEPKGQFAQETAPVADVGANVPAAQLAQAVADVA